MLGQNGYSLTCEVTVDASLNPSITYQWTKNNGTQTQVGADRLLSFSPLRLSDAGRYTCQATVSPCIIVIMDTEDIALQSELSYSAWVTMSMSLVYNQGLIILIKHAHKKFHCMPLTIVNLSHHYGT